MPPRDQERVLPVEADARARRPLAVDVVVGVDEHAVLAAEPAPELVELLAQLGVAVGPRVARQPPLPRPRLGRRPVVAERRRDHRPRSGQQRLRMAGDLRPAHREAHPGEEAALAPVADVPLGLLVRDGGRGPDRIEAELRTDPGQLSGGHDRIVPVKAIRIHEDGGPEVLRYEDVPDPVAGPGRGARLAARRVAQPPRPLGSQGAPVGAEAAHPRRRRRRRARRHRRAGGDQPRPRARRRDHGDRRAHRRDALRDDRGSGGERVPARRRDRLRDRGGVPARLRDRLPDARDEGAAAGRRVGADLGDRRRRRDRVVRDRPRARREDPRHLLVGGEARARPRVGRRPRGAPRGGGRRREGARRRRRRRRDGGRGDLEGLARRGQARRAE